MLPNVGIRDAFMTANSVMTSGQEPNRLAYLWAGRKLDFFESCMVFDDGWRDVQGAPNPRCTHSKVHLTHKEAALFTPLCTIEHGLSRLDIVW